VTAAPAWWSLEDPAALARAIVRYYRELNGPFMEAIRVKQVLLGPDGRGDRDAGGINSRGGTRRGIGESSLAAGDPARIESIRVNSPRRPGGTAARHRLRLARRHRGGSALIFFGMWFRGRRAAHGPVWPAVPLERKRWPRTPSPSTPPSDRDRNDGYEEVFSRQLGDRGGGHRGRALDQQQFPMCSRRWRRRAARWCDRSRTQRRPHAAALRLLAGDRFGRNLGSGRGTSGDTSL
jgi:hypothetical protein